MDSPEKPAPPSVSAAPLPGTPPADPGAGVLWAMLVTIRRGGREVVSNAFFMLHPGEILAVIGPNGSGKSSLIMAAAGLLEPASGAVFVNGFGLADLRAQDRARLVAYVPQRSELVAPLAVGTVVAMGHHAHSPEPFRARGFSAALAQAMTPPTRPLVTVAEALAAVDATHLAERNFAELSGGEAQRVLIARALATGARFLLLDEPTSALDIGHRLALGELLRTRARAGDAILVALHDLNEARTIADRVLLLDQGRQHLIGTPDEVIAPGPVRAVYGVDLVPAAAYAFRRATGEATAQLAEGR